MSRTPRSSHRREPLHVVQVLSGRTDSVGDHVRSLAAGLVARGVRVTVCAPSAAQARHRFSEAGAEFVALPCGRPDLVAALRSLCATADVVHAHGLRAGLLGDLALSGRRRRAPLVLSWHHRAPRGGAQARMNRLLERRAVRAARIVLGVSSDLVARARHRGARDARLVPVDLAAPALRVSRTEPGAERREKIRAELGAVDRPLIVAAGPLEAHQGCESLLTAARAWRHLDPVPLVLVAGEGSRRTALQRRIDDEELPVRLLGALPGGPRPADDLQWAGEVLEVADVAILPARRSTRSPLARHAMECGVPLVASVEGVPELVGAAAVLVPYADADALSAEVGALLEDSGRRAALAALGRVQAAAWPTEDGTVNQLLGIYDELVEL
ncbi:glycosyltransferase family 4 protein [Streptomyces sp. XM4193]|uniref:glycosyltransferase family 4 protein n=1 Tax=Streptomyces sp. XM4193 TaxID=2929782 RepID=UPI001FF773AB|nr:glycosyltransferase family 4 protein [Streptomyces sp. XM4193]MCK1799047.1 glycosyltransferase family 4 protein [Streptomyces sp. XM4193]